MRKKIVIAVVVLAAAATAARLVYRNANDEPKDRILISGNIELTEVNIGFKYSGKLIERTVDEGDRSRKAWWWRGWIGIS